MEVSVDEDTAAPAVPRPKSVNFQLPTHDGTDKETSHLLADSSTMNYQQHENHRLYGENGHPPAVKKPANNDFYSAPLPLLATSKFELHPVPATNEWPKEALRIACTHCGHFIETNPIEETEFMGCKECFSSRAVFRRAHNHYCPNCSEPVGVHYTGDDCFWCSDSGKNTLTCGSLLLTCCGGYK